MSVYINVHIFLLPYLYVINEIVIWIKNLNLKLKLNKNHKKPPTLPLL